MSDGRSAGSLFRISRVVRRRVIPALFGDRVGLTLFLGVVLVLSTFWRVGFYITDSYAIANTVVNVAEGHFAITRLEYSLTLGSQPGLYRSGSQVFGRNYAAAVLSVPLYWLLEGASALAELRLVLAGSWSLLAAGFASQLGRILDRPRVPLWGTVLALVAFLANLALATPLDPGWTGLLAVQLLTLLAAGVVAVALYRLGTTFHGQRVGVAAGTLAALSLPIAFWSTVPKRHVLSAALIAVVLLAFARSRQPGTLAIRASAYAAVGMLAWLHAAEALVVFVVLVPVDLATAPSNDRRTLAVLGLAFALSLFPFFLTNVAASGNPLETPRMLSSLGDAGQIGPDGSVSVDTGGEPTPEPTPEPPTTAPGEPPTAPTAPTDSGESGPFGALVGLLSGLLGTIAAIATAVPARLGELWSFVADGIGIVTGDPERLYHVFVRSGRIPGVNYRVNDLEAIELTVLEAAPVLAAVVALPVIWGNRAAESGLDSMRGAATTIRSTPRYATDLLAGGIVVAFTLLYLPRLPLHSLITVRYLVPIMPIALYGVIRLPPVQVSLERNWSRFVRSYLSASVVGIVGTVAAFVWLRPAIGEAMQFHALLNLAVGGLAALVVVFATFDRGERSVATAIGAAGGAGTALFVLSGIEYFTYGEHAFPVARWLSAWLPLF